MIKKCKRCETGRIVKSKDKSKICVLCGNVIEEPLFPLKIKKPYALYPKRRKKR